MAYTRVRNPFDASVVGFPSSRSFSNWCWMGDYAQLSIQQYGPSAVTLYGSDAPGWTQSLSTAVDTSVITVTGAAGVYKVEPGFGWVQFQRSSSTNTIYYVGQSRR